MSLSSLQAYIALSQHDVAALAWVRGSDRLFPATPTEYGVGGTINVPPLGLALALDDLYAQFCETLGRVGEAQASLYLGRFALLAMVRLADADAIRSRRARVARLGLAG